MKPLRLIISIVSAFALVVTVPLSRACMEAAWKHGYMDDQQLVLGTTEITSPCACCGLCYQLDDCASLSYNSEGKKCRLYRSVAGYHTLKPHRRWQYFVKPNSKSGHHQFCRLDTDCAKGGEFCRGRVCTALQTVTCNTIKEDFGGRGFFNWKKNQRVHGWINGGPLPLICSGHHTLILKMQKERGFTNETLWSYNADLALKDEPNYSILGLADSFRQLGKRPKYRLRVHAHNDDDDDDVIFAVSVPRNIPVIGSRPRHGFKILNSTCLKQKASLPRLVCGSNTLLSIQFDGDGAEGGIATQDGQLGSWFGKAANISLYLREDKNTTQGKKTTVSP